METLVFNGRALAEKIKEDLRRQVAAQGLKPHLAVILVGQNPASLTYVRRKEKACQELGFIFQLVQLPEETSAETLRQTLLDLNSDAEVDGVLLQLPLPARLKAASKQFISLIAPEKDIDGLTANSPFPAAVTQAVAAVLKNSRVDCRDRQTVVLGRGQTAGAPIAQWLRDQGARVAVVHSRTPDPERQKLLAQADIIVSCVGRPHLLHGQAVKEDAVVIGVGSGRLGNKVAGDLDEASFLGRVRLISPTPGGVGPLTIVFLLQNLLQAAQKRAHLL